MWWCWWWWCGFSTDYNTTPPKLFCFGLLVGLWQIITRNREHQFGRDEADETENIREDKSRNDVKTQI